MNMCWMTERRRALIAATAHSEKWDFVWNYTDGSPLQNGFTSVVNGAASLTAVTGGYKLAAGLNTYYFLAKEDYKLPAVTMEIEFQSISPTFGSGIQNTRIAVSNGINGLCLYANQGNWRIMDAGADSGTIASPFSDAVRVIRIAINGDYADAWIDGQQVVTHFATSRALYTTRTMVAQQNGGQCVVSRIKLRAGV